MNPGGIVDPPDAPTVGELKRTAKASRFDWSGPLNAMTPLAVREMVTGQVPGWWARRSARRMILEAEEVQGCALALATALDRAQRIAIFPSMGQDDLIAEACTATHWFVRLKAMELVEDQSTLVDIIKDEKVRAVKLRAISRLLHVQLGLARVTLDAADYIVASEAMKKIKEPELLRALLGRLTLTGSACRCMEHRILQRVKALEKAEAEAEKAAGEPATV